MTAEEIRLTVEPPEVAITPRMIEVSCGDSYVTLRQIMSRTDEWTVYEGDAHPARQMGVVGKVDHAPKTATSGELIPWAAELVTRRQRAALARRALNQLVDDRPRPPEDVPT